MSLNYSRQIFEQLTRINTALAADACESCLGTGRMDDCQDYGMGSIVAGSYECFDCDGTGRIPQ